MLKTWNRPRFDLVELCGAGLCFLLGGLLVGRTIPSWETYPERTAWQEADRLRVTYGPTHYSEHQEEWIIRDFFKDQRDGVFVDVGASHYRMHSNTFYLEERLGWSGLAIDPQAAFAADYARYRPRTRFFAFFASDVSNETATLFIAGSNVLSASADRRYAENFTGRLSTVDRIPTITLTDLLDGLGVRRIDLLSIDVELSEPKVLAGFDIRRFKPRLVCIEAHTKVRQSILDYFAKHGYVALGRYLSVDEQNLYFTPLQ